VFKDLNRKLGLRKRKERRERPGETCVANTGDRYDYVDEIAEGNVVPVKNGDNITVYVLPSRPVLLLARIGTVAQPRSWGRPSHPTNETKRVREKRKPSLTRGRSREQCEPKSRKGRRRKGGVHWGSWRTFGDRQQHNGGERRSPQTTPSAVALLCGKVRKSDWGTPCFDRGNRKHDLRL